MQDLWNDFHFCISFPQAKPSENTGSLIVYLSINKNIFWPQWSSTIQHTEYVVNKAYMVFFIKRVYWFELISHSFPYLTIIWKGEKESIMRGPMQSEEVTSTLMVKRWRVSHGTQENYRLGENLIQGSGESRVAQSCHWPEAGQPGYRSDTKGEWHMARENSSGMITRIMLRISVLIWKELRILSRGDMAQFAF